MKTVIVGLASSLVIGLGLASAASAADLLRRPPAASPAATYDWSGMYLGGVLGGGWETTDTTSGVGTLFIPGPGIPPLNLRTTTSNGFIGGLEGGSNYQIGKLVVGWEGDILWGNINGSNATGFTFAGAPATALLTVDTPWTGKAGVAYEHTDFTASAGAPGLAFAATGSDNRTGWLVGGGLEYAAWDNWTIKAEYDYLDFGNRAVTLNGTTTFFGGAPLPTFVTALHNQHISEFKAGINWKFMPNFW
jgi:outer membrane immunogenic protein